MRSIGPRLQLAQRQALAMTPQLQQAIRLLQMSQQELAVYLREELDRNPLLAESGNAEGGDAREDGPAAAQADDHRPAETAAGRAEGGDDAASVMTGSQALADIDERWDKEHADRGGDGLALGPIRGAVPDGDAPDRTARLADRPLSLEQHIIAQVAIELPGNAERLIALALLELLDEAGYLRGDPADVAERLGATAQAVAVVLGKLQQLDPPGVFARSLAECLALQLADRNRLDPAMQALLDNLELLAQRDFAGLRRRCGVGDEDLAEMIGELRALDPKPGLRFDVPVADPIVPDIFLRPARDPDTGAEGWHLELNTDTLPRVAADRRYHATLVLGARDKATREFLTERLQSANWLVKAVDQRAQTILKVAREIVRQQDGFFRRGVGALRPLVLRDIAASVALHESTVSRVTSNKFIATPRGIFELKYFFTSAIASSTGAAAMSSEAVRLRIRRLIDAEAAQEPLSDDRIVELLRTEGIDIARRTVAKSRDAMRIPSSVERRRRQGVGGMEAGLASLPAQALARISQRPTEWEA
jgi:RNA polymerase sigma-54 factor